ncbi:6212_t:CDS:2 [Paraglomus occultum]|uniref:6212_t:CDS:1 n=1 Tax=Paraglomus occultum TaxID=144539 RepID=A0A9N8VR22_9GLOM|nr:6212_t:CDS:2 [Paraglomus occultum]
MFTEDTTSDLKTLYACALVSRQWCIDAIPYLWANPFINPRGKTPLSTLRRLLTCKERTKLGIAACDKDCHLESGCDCDNNDAAQLAFNYPEFITTINLHRLTDCYEREFENNESANTMRVILELLVRHGTRLKVLEAGWDEGMIFFEYKVLVQRLKKFKLLGSLYTILDQVGKYCKNVEFLYIPFCDFASEKVQSSFSSAITAIASQRSLKHLTLSGSRSPDHASFRSLIESILTQASTLETITLDRFYFDNDDMFKVLASCTKLRIIDFKRCRVKDDKVVEVLVNSNLEKLEKVVVMSNCGSMKLLQWAIRISGEHYGYKTDVCLY